MRLRKPLSICSDGTTTKQWVQVHVRTKYGVDTNYCVQIRINQTGNQYILCSAIVEPQTPTPMLLTRDDSNVIVVRGVNCSDTES